MRSGLACFFGFVSAATSSMDSRDFPIAGSAIQYLDSSSGLSWTAASPRLGVSMPGQVPGDVISDLHANGVIGNPLYELNFKNSSLWMENWSYSVRFELDPAFTGADGDTLLVFEGIKMGATITLNGRVIGSTDNQFTRYTFPIAERLLDRASVDRTYTLAVHFNSSIFCDGRWMACTGGWDWAPYSDTSQEGAATFSRGIWKPVYLVRVKTIAITYLVPHITYMGPYPITPLNDANKQDFELRADIHVWSALDGVSELTVSGSWGRRTSLRVNHGLGDSKFTVKIVAPAADVDLWWPIGMGKQRMYTINATVTSLGAPTDISEMPEVPLPLRSPVVSTARPVAFRYVALVTGNDTDAEWVAKAKMEEGTELHGMFFRVNGVVLYARGANVVPMEELEGWYSEAAHRRLVASAAEANFNMLRVWGGGVYLPRAFYNECDRRGVLVFHDVMYAQNGHIPRATAAQEVELRDNVRRLAHHPSIVLWDGCNECTVDMNATTAIYATFVMRVVADEDPTRVVWPSCPADGWKSGVHRLTSTPNGNPLSTPDTSAKRCTTVPGRECIEIHRPKWQGSGDGFATVNSVGSLAPSTGPKVGPHIYRGLFPSAIPHNFSRAMTGPQYHNMFSSESPGGSVFSSFESMSPTLAPEHWGVHGGAKPASCTNKRCDGNNVMAQRNYANDNFIAVMFGARARQSLNGTGEFEFKRQLFWSMIAQALVVKQNIESSRSINRFGTLVWQLNEIWPTGGWGSLEYGNGVFPGQVLGGRWKPLHYWYRQTIFADIISSCDGTGLCYVKNDSPLPFAGIVTLNVTTFSTAEAIKVHQEPVSMAAGAGTIYWFEVAAIAAIDGRRQVLEVIVTDDGGTFQKNVVPFSTPGAMILPRANLTVTPKRRRNANGDDFFAEISGTALAMYTVLTTAAHGRFETNAFLFRPPHQSVRFMHLGLGPLTHATLDEAYKAFSDTLRVEDVSVYH